MNRNYAIDGFRGLLLVVIAINHLESVAMTPFTTNPFGFVSAAEAFIFLSGVMASMLYGQLVDNPVQLKRRIWQRVHTVAGFGGCLCGPGHTVGHGGARAATNCWR